MHMRNGDPLSRGFPVIYGRRLKMARSASLCIMAVAGLVVSTSALAGEFVLNFGPEEIVKADGNDIAVPGYSVPSFVDWNNDGLQDLVVGEGGAIGTVTPA